MSFIALTVIAIGIGLILSYSPSASLMTAALQTTYRN
jgi:hypothetical protein